jgi:hypothetical protein
LKDWRRDRLVREEKAGFRGEFSCVLGLNEAAFAACEERSR